MERMINDLAHQRDSMDVLTSMVLRLENSNGAILTELRAMQREINRTAARVSKLEAS